MNFYSPLSYSIEIDLFIFIVNLIVLYVSSSFLALNLQTDPPTLLY